MARRRHLQRVLRARLRGVHWSKSEAHPHETPIFSDGGITLYTDDRNAEALDWAVRDRRLLSEYLRAHLAGLVAGDHDAPLLITCDDGQLVPPPPGRSGVLRVHLGADAAAGRATLEVALARALEASGRTPAVRRRVPGAESA